MTSLPEALVQYRTELEDAIGRELAARPRRGERRRRMALLAAAVVVVVVGTASAFAAVRGLLWFEPFPEGRVTRTFDGIRLSFTVPPESRQYGSRWENGPIDLVRRVGKGAEFRTRSLYISKSTVGGQSAEAVIFWTSFPDGDETAPCAQLLRPSVGRSTTDLAAAVARAPGTRVVNGPTPVTVGGRPAMHVSLTVRRDFGCDPGFFFTWQGECWGACWGETNAGTSIRVWIVDVEGKHVFIEAETDKGVPIEVQREITKIVRSIRFD